MIWTGIRRGGFSLIEVLVAMMIFTVGATSIIALFAAASASHKRSVDRTRAAMLAEEIVAQVQARYFPETSPGQIVDSLVETLPETIDGYRWDITLIKPGEEGMGMRNRLSRMEGKTERKASSGHMKKESKTDLKTKARPSEEEDEVEKEIPTRSTQEARSWMAEELLVRVTIGWSQSGRLITDQFDTIILPRPVPPWMQDSRLRR